MQCTKLNEGINASTKKPKGMKHTLVMPKSPHTPQGKNYLNYPNIFISSSSPIIASSSSTST
jgi:hypothetical protein